MVRPRRAASGPRPPRVVRYLLDCLDVRDGQARLTARPERAFASQLDELIDTICDPDRRGLALVAAAPEGADLALWTDRVESLTRDTVGLAATYVLDPTAALELSREFGPHHGVPLGTIRTFLPAADPASPADGRRHRIPRRATLESSPDGRIRGILGTVARARVSDVELPAAVRRVLRSVARWEAGQLALEASPLADSVLPPGKPVIDRLGAAAGADVGRTAVDAAAAADTRVEKRATRRNRILAPKPPRRGQAEEEHPSPARAGGGKRASRRSSRGLERAVGSLLAVLLGESSNIDEESAQKAIDVARAREAEVKSLQELVGATVDQLDRQVSRAAQLRDTVDRAELDAAIEAESAVRLEGETAALQREVDRLRGELMRLGEGEAAWSGPKDEIEQPPPIEMAEVLDRAEALENVEITADLESLLELDELDPHGRAAIKTWSALMALNDYARVAKTGDFRGGFHTYCQTTPPGCVPWSPDKHSGESETIKNSPKLNRMRHFPVPTAVDASGKTLMIAHCKLLASRSVSPRLYYLDDVARTGKIYVGYIGRHLENTRTN